MSPKPISRSADLQRLRAEGYDLVVIAGYLVVSGVPYVNDRKEVKYGTLVMTLTLADDVTAKPDNHQAMFAGEYPCHADGTPIEAIRHGSTRQELTPGLVVDHSFSGKSTGGDYRDYYEKVTRYVTILSSQAAAIDPSATARTYPFVEASEEESVFMYTDTASSNAGTVALGKKLELSAVAIVGLGGTGSHVLDLVAKTPVKAIHLFDGDSFLQHNAFRTPGAASGDDLRRKPKKVKYLAARYGKLHRGIVPHAVFVEGETVADLREMNFVFLCLDRGRAKREIVDALTEWGIPFIDASMGVDLINGMLRGVVTVTTVTDKKHDHLERRIRFSDADPEADYSRSIQIADLNALNAALAVVRWKKLLGFYPDEGQEYYSTYTIGSGVLTAEEKQ